MKSNPAFFFDILDISWIGKPVNNSLICAHFSPVLFLSACCLSPDSDRKAESFRGFSQTSSPPSCRVGLQVWSGFCCWRLVMDEYKIFTFIIPFIFSLTFHLEILQDKSCLVIPPASYLSVWGRTSAKGTLFYTCLWPGSYKWHFSLNYLHTAFLKTG